MPPVLSLPAEPEAAAKLLTLKQQLEDLLSAIEDVEAGREPEAYSCEAARHHEIIVGD